MEPTLHPENRWPTPAEWVDYFLSLPREHQETRASKAIAASQATLRCVAQGHEELLYAAMRQRDQIILYVNGSLEEAIRVEQSRGGTYSYAAVVLASVQKDLRRKLGLPEEGE